MGGILAGKDLETLRLSYITAANTIGIYETCACIAAQYDPSGGYLDFSHVSYAESPL